MDQVAAQTDSKAFVLAQIALTFRRGGLGKPEIRTAIGHLGDLRDDPARLGEGVVHYPQWAAAAHPAEVKCCGGLALRDVAGFVGPDEDKRHPTQLGSLQRREPVTHRLVADLETASQQVDVVP